MEYLFKAEKHQSMSALSIDKTFPVFIDHDATDYPMDGAVVKALSSHQCGPGSIPRFNVMCGWSLLVLYSPLRGFSSCTPPAFPSPQKPTYNLM